jgi:peptidoglycan/LPS O-acetylase OafA/YrhL
MNRALSKLGPALVMAGAMLVATALVAVAPQAPWTAVAGPLLLVFALLATDLVQRRRSGGRSLPSASSLLLAAIILLACGILAAGDPGRLAGMMPILGACAALPAILASAGARRSCRRA